MNTDHGKNTEPDEARQYDKAKEAINIPNTFNFLHIVVVIELHLIIIPT
jgi:hypothetical protein